MLQNSYLLVVLHSPNSSQSQNDKSQHGFLSSPKQCTQIVLIADIFLTPKLLCVDPFEKVIKMTFVLLVVVRDFATRPESSSAFVGSCNNIPFLGAFIFLWGGVFFVSPLMLAILRFWRTIRLEFDSRIMSYESNRKWVALLQWLNHLAQMACQNLLPTRLLPQINPLTPGYLLPTFLFFFSLWYSSLES